MSAPKKPESQEDERQRESRRTLERVATESETIGSSSLVRMADKASAHLSAKDANGEDGAEIWGRRVGRGFAVIAVGLLLIWLYDWFSR